MTRLLLSVTLLFGATLCLFQTPVLAEVITVCSQNLARYGEKSKRQNDAEKQKQLGYLTGRIRKAKCDIVAVQEVVGETKLKAAENLEQVARALSERTHRSFISIVGDGRDKFIRNGYLIDQGLLNVVEVASYSDLPLPRYRKLAPPNFFERAPLGVRVEIKNSADGPKQLFLINNHFKSKAFGHKDVTGLNFELIRMQQAEAVRNLIETGLSPEQQRALLVVLGDRNSGIDSASTAIIKGEYLLQDFMSENCRVEQSGEPKCKTKGAEASTLTGLFGFREQQFPGVYRGGSYRYKGREEYLDEIFLRSSDIKRVLDKVGKVRIGTEGDYFRGSDHKLVWADLDLN
jgi:endonuclease/exonuclease/phosphatase family metal-dependent hydrolase